MDVETRISTLERDVSSMKADLAVIRSNYATKEDLQSVRIELQKTINVLTWKMYGFGSLLVAAVYFVARNVH
jgi:hypothetical protein